MLIVALVLAVIGLAALVTAVVTSNELIAWVCIAASVIGVILLIIDAVRERSRGQAARASRSRRGRRAEFDADYPDDEPADADDRGRNHRGPSRNRRRRSPREEDRKTR